jgi:hypothetical protein
VTRSAAAITISVPALIWGIWHDTALIDFLADPADRTANLDRLARCLVSGGHAVIATFAPDGPERCSVLPVFRYSHESLAETLCPRFAPVTSRLHLHHTPRGKPQSFRFSIFRKSA